MNSCNMSLSTALLCLAISGSAVAQTPSKTEYKAAKEAISTQYKADKTACSSMSGNAKDICIEEAKGRESVAKAELEAKFNPTDKTRYEVLVAKADAAYEVAKEKCDDLAGDAMSACNKEAKSTHAAALAEAKDQAGEIPRAVTDERRTFLPQGREDHLSHLPRRHRL